jgi:soluble lytic murein transglycosylase-like protein
VNRRNRNRSVDRGLFQLNDGSFPKLTETDFFNPRVNAYYGMAHLRWCLDFGGSEVAGLAMYNAGVNRVNGGTTPRQTLDHVARIMEFRKGIEALFQLEYEQGHPPLRQKAKQIAIRN